MLALRLRLLWNGFRQSPAAALLGFSLGAGLAFGMGWGTSWFLNFLSNEIFGSGAFLNRLVAAFTRDVLVDRLLGSLLLVLSSAVVLSALPNAVSVLYASEDLPLHLALPQSAVRVFLFKVGEVFAVTALWPTLLLLPVLFAYGLHYAAPPVFFVGAVAVALCLFAFPVALGVGLALPLVRYAPAGRAREWAAAVGAVLGGALIFLLRALRPEMLMNYSQPTAFGWSFARPSSQALTCVGHSLAAPFTRIPVPGMTHESIIQGFALVGLSFPGQGGALWPGTAAPHPYGSKPISPIPKSWTAFWKPSATPQPPFCPPRWPSRP
nr:hypothetical protein [Meiothermus luteus]